MRLEEVKLLFAFTRAMATIDRALDEDDRAEDELACLRLKKAALNWVMMAHHGVAVDRGGVLVPETQDREAHEGKLLAELRKKAEVLFAEETGLSLLPWAKATGDALPLAKTQSEEEEEP